jgi:hypothetical protein
VLIDGTNELRHESLLNGVSDSDLLDGAGQVILEYLNSNFEGVNQMEILDMRDLQKALRAAPLASEGVNRRGEYEAVLVRALRLLGAGYYRTLLLEEKERVGKINFRFEAMMRFKERIQRSDLDSQGPPACPTL